MAIASPIGHPLFPAPEAARDRGGIVADVRRVAEIVTLARMGARRAADAERHPFVPPPACQAAAMGGRP
jgi:hypothetical protein